MIGEWLGSVAVAGFVTGVADVFVPKERTRIAGAVKFVSALILIFVTLLPLFKLAQSGSNDIKNLVSPPAQAQEKASPEITGFMTDAAVENVETVLKGGLASELGREDFDIYVEWSDAGNEILVSGIKVIYYKGSDFPSAFVARKLQEELNTEVELCERDE